MITEKLLQLATVGGEWVLWALIAISVLSVGIVVERVWWFWRHRCNVDELMPDLMAKLRMSDHRGAVAALQSDRSEEALIVRRCLEWQHAGREAIMNVLAATLRERRPGLEKGLVFLGTVGNNAPFVGLFGTVLGVVEAFVQLGKAQAGGMDHVMSAIGEALVATAVGILVAIPAVVAYNILSKKAIQVEENAETMVNLILAVREELKRKNGELDSTDLSEVRVPSGS
jgi:biopolymer transport protein ExbB/biopolymer transport protein TolQ